MRKIIIVLASVFILASCSDIKPIETRSTNNLNGGKVVTVDVLFDFDGIRMYRFYDDGHYVYFAKVLNGARTTWQQSKGKTTRYVSVETVGD